MTPTDQSGSSGWQSAPLWAEWLRLTRLQWSGKIAFETESNRWLSAHIAIPEQIDVRFSEAGGNYRTSLANHVATVQDGSLFCELLLQRSYALTERHCKLVQYLCDSRRWHLMDDGLSQDELYAIDEKKLEGGVEAWSEKVMQSTGQNWTQVYGGKAGLIEISVIRNALTHGYARASKSLIDLAAKRGCEIPFAEDQDIKIGFDLLHEYRGRLRSFCRIIGDGAFHLERGTHRRE